MGRIEYEGKKFFGERRKQLSRLSRIDSQKRRTAADYSTPIAHMLFTFARSPSILPGASWSPPVILTDRGATRASDVKDGPRSAVGYFESPSAGTTRFIVAHPTMSRTNGGTHYWMGIHRRFAAAGENITHAAGFAHPGYRPVFLLRSRAADSFTTLAHFV
jgi:hypothetical protein